jgi:hypothetical protein
MTEKQFISSEIYEKMIAENLGFTEMAAMLINTSHQHLRYHIKRYCKEYNKPMPASVKRGRKTKVKIFKIKE